MSYQQRLGIYGSVLLGSITLWAVADHQFASGRLFDWQALYHHEPLILAVFTLAVGLLIGSLLKR